jgi:hypothetical protein
VPVLFKWGGRKDASASSRPSPSDDTPEAPSTSKVLPRVLTALATVPAPVLMDLGPVVGGNIAFFGEQLACKIFVEDLFAEVERQAQAGTREAVAAVLLERLERPEASLDGILCWDLFDFLDKPTGQAVAARLVSLLRPGGIIYGFFGQTSTELTQYTRFMVESPSSLRLRTTPASPVKRTVILNRDLNRMFEGLAVAESVLLKSGSRETLFRKPS